jgi:peptidoglycan-associated lipoprotein
VNSRKDGAGEVRELTCFEEVAIGAYIAPIDQENFQEGIKQVVQFLAKRGEKMLLKLRYIVVLVVVMAAALLLVACKKKVSAPAPPPPPPPTPPAPMVTLTADPSTIDRGQSVTLSWTSQNSTDLDLEPEIGKVQAQASQTATPQDSTTYTLTATGPGGTNTATARVTVTVPAPPPPPPAPPKPAELSAEDMFEQAVMPAYFDFDKADIRADAQAALTSDGDLLKEHTSIKFTIEGNCDERGSEEYNLGLGDRRATAAKNFLVNLGISADRISTVSYGKDRPVCSESNEDCWQKNRRAGFKPGASK